MGVGDSCDASISHCALVRIRTLNLTLLSKSPAGTLRTNGLLGPVWFFKGAQHLSKTRSDITSLTCGIELVEVCPMLFLLSDSELTVAPDVCTSVWKLNCLTFAWSLISLSQNALQVLWWFWRLRFDPLTFINPFLHSGTQAYWPPVQTRHGHVSKNSCIFFI